jgi:hypothetical protein
MLKANPAVIISFWLLVGSTGCTSVSTIETARGYTRERVQVSKGDRVFKVDSIYYAAQYPKEKDSSNLPMPENLPEDPTSAVYAYRPQPAYYLLLPLAIPWDILTSPVQLSIYLILRQGM